MSDVINPFLDEDEEVAAPPQATTVPSFIINRAPAPAQPVAPVEVKPEPAATKQKTQAPSWGQKGFRKGVPNPHKGTPRTRVTEATVPILAFVGKLPGCTAEAPALISVTKGIEHLGQEGGKLRTVPGTLKLLKKFEGMGLVTSYTSKGENGVTHWGITSEGVVQAQEYGHLLEPNEASVEGLSGMAYERLNHYRYVALVAAKYASPSKKAFGLTGIEHVGLDELISEPQVRRDFYDTKTLLEANKKEGKPSDWGILRTRLLKEAQESVNKGLIGWDDFMVANPTLRMFGLPLSEFGTGKPMTKHEPDLFINRDRYRSTAASKSILVEVELTRKHWNAIASFLKVMAFEKKHGLVIGEVHLHTHRRDIVKLYKKVDKAIGTELVESGFLKFKPLTHADGTPVVIKNKVGD